MSLLISGQDYINNATGSGVYKQEKLLHNYLIRFMFRSIRNSCSS
jgi:hypothetical protein